jgi:hypothetical protein
MLPKALGLAHNPSCMVWHRRLGGHVNYHDNNLQLQSIANRLLGRHLLHVQQALLKKSRTAAGAARLHHNLTAPVYPPFDC